jgi:hypothetical protein
MINKNGILLVGLAVGFGQLPALADKLGDPAQPLVVKEWIKGQPVDVLDGKNIYVVEFWAAIGSASRVVIPKLNELQKQYRDKGVVVLGISDEPVDKLQQFVASQGVVIDYAIAADDVRKTARKYMVAYGQNGIPHVFIVGKDRKVLWHGHPLQGLDEALEQIVAGRYDLAAAIKADAVRAEVDEYRLLARRADPKAKDVGRKLLQARTNNAAALGQFAYRIITDSANTNRDFALATEAIDQAEKAAGTNMSQLVMARAIVLFETGKKDEGLALANQALDMVKDPKERASAEAYLRVMEARLEAERRANMPKPPKPPKPPKAS